MCIETSHLLIYSNRITSQVCHIVIHCRIGGACDTQQVFDVAVGSNGRARMDTGIDNR